LEQNGLFTPLCAERRESDMITRLITVHRQPANEAEGTGTFADGIFPLTSAEQSAFDRDHGLRTSYTRDYVVVRRLDEAPRAYA
jgi:hypothetical protein